MEFSPKLMPITDPGFCGHPTLSNFDQTPKVFDSIETSYEEDTFTPEFMESIKNNILGFAQVKRILHNKDFIFIGTSQVEEKLENEKSYLISIFYNYTDNVTVEISHDIKLKKIIKIENLSYQPSPTRTEIKQAIEMAKMDKYFQDKNLSDIEGGAIIVNSIDKDSTYYNHRLLDVRFRQIHERLPFYQALVDLSTKSVVNSGLVSCDSKHNNVEEKKIG
jgi:hypothetical protein